MARKKLKKKKTKNFNNSPFKNLKGLVVSEKHASLPAKEKQAPATAADKEDDDGALFEREMDMLKVEKRHGNGMARALPPEDVSADKVPDPLTPPATDQEMFLEALGSMDTVFRDEYLEEEEPHAAPRRMRQLRHGKRTPEAQLDLHGANREQARQKVRYFLEDCVYQGIKTALIITGRGKRSQEGPVLRADMEKYLSHEAMAWVVEWGRAPARYGGDGALVVFLRSSRKK